MPIIQASISDSQALLLRPWRTRTSASYSHNRWCPESISSGSWKHGDDSGLDKAILFHWVSTRPARLSGSNSQCNTDSFVVPWDGIDGDDCGYSVRQRRRTHRTLRQTFASHALTRAGVVSMCVDTYQT